MGKVVVLAGRFVHGLSAFNFFKKSGRLIFKTVGGGKVYLKLSNIKSMSVIVPSGGFEKYYGYLVEYETENADYYKRYAKDVEEVMKLVKEGKLKLARKRFIQIVTEWDADEPERGYFIDLRRKEVISWSYEDFELLEYIEVAEECEEKCGGDEVCAERCLYWSGYQEYYYDSDY